MKMQLIVFILSLLATSVSPAHEGHIHHPKHNMILFGEQEVFASHIVYRKPHNYQVILKLKLDPQANKRYLDQRAKFPQDRFIYLLDEMDIATIASASAISGSMLRFDANDNRNEVLPKVDIPRQDFEIVYFNELPEF